ncbi:zinc-ribbon domain protein [uncultured archaeon]|nr:zinc-ribbon domain protein [uncultured archaeon]
MVYQNMFVAAIRSNGKILREFENKVVLPFGTKYEILLKNLNSVRAQVKVNIDGEDANINWLVLPPNSEISLERFVRNNLSAGNRFKFIERTKNIEQHRGMHIDDGLIRIEYQFEQAWEPYTVTTCPATSYWVFPSNTTYTETSPIIYSCTTDTYSTEKSSTSGIIANQTGFTTEGSESHQQFYPVDNFLCYSPQVIVLQLIGEGSSGEKIQKPITVETKPRCKNCGRLNKATSKFCSECGTALKIF